MRITILVLLFYLFPIGSNIIADNIDKPYKDTISEDFNTMSVEYLLNISRQSRIRDFDSAELVLLRANHLADSLKEKESQIDALLLLGLLYFDNAYFENANDIFNRVLTNFRSDLSDEQYANVKHALGLNHIKFNNYDKTINCIQEAHSYYKREQSRKYRTLH